MSTVRSDVLGESLQRTGLLQDPWSTKVPWREQDPLPRVLPDVPSAKQLQKIPLIVAGTAALGKRAKSMFAR